MTQRTQTMSGPLTKQQVDEYRAEGFLLVPSVLSRDEATSLRVEAHALIDRLTKHHAVEATWSSVGQLDTAGGALRPTRLQHCHDLQFHLASFTKLLLDERLTRSAAQLMGVANIQLHHNKLFIKPPANGSPFPMHQDWPFFPHRDDSVTAMIVHLDDAPIERGCVRVMPKSHLHGRYEHEGERDFYLPVDQFPLEQASAVPARAGDVLFFSCLAVHGSGVNTSDVARTTWLLQLRDAGDEPTVDRHRSPGQGMMLLGDDPLSHRPPSSL